VWEKGWSDEEDEVVLSAVYSHARRSTQKSMSLDSSNSRTKASGSVGVHDSSRDKAHGEKNVNCCCCLYVASL
jgi:hypothetical protein